MDYDPATITIESLTAEAALISEHVAHGLHDATNEELRIECVRRGLIHTVKQNAMYDERIYNVAGAEELKKAVAERLGRTLMQQDGAVTFDVADRSGGPLGDYPMKYIRAACTFWDRRKR